MSHNLVAMLVGGMTTSIGHLDHWVWAGGIVETAKMQRPAKARPGVVSGQNGAGGVRAGVALEDLAVVGPLDLQVEARVAGQHQVREGEEDVAREGVDVFEGELVQQLPVRL